MPKIQIRPDDGDEIFEFNIAGAEPTAAEEASMRQRIRDYRAQAEASKPALTEYPGEMGVGLLRGAATTGIASVRGLADLADAGVGLLGYDLGAGRSAREWADPAQQAVDEALPRDERFKDSTAVNFSEGLGSTVPFLATAMIPYVGAPAAVGLGIGSGAAEQEARIRAYEAQTGQTVDPDTKNWAILTGGAIGSTEAIPLQRILGRVKNTIPASAKEYVYQQIRHAFMGAGEEGAQEALSGLAQDFTEKGFYNENLSVGDSLLSDFAMGAGVGGLLQGVVGAAGTPRLIGKLREAEEAARVRENKVEQQARQHLEKEINLQRNPVAVSALNLESTPNENAEQYAQRQVAAFNDTPDLFPRGTYSVLPLEDGTFEVRSDKGVVMGRPAANEQDAMARARVYGNYSMNLFNKEQEAEQARRVIETEQIAAGGTPGVLTKDDIHKLLDKKNIVWDEDPSFKALTKSVFGKEKLDDLTPQQVTEFHSLLRGLPDASKPTTVGELNMTGAEPAQVAAPKLSLPGKPEAFDENGLLIPEDLSEGVDIRSEDLAPKPPASSATRPAYYHEVDPSAVGSILTGKHTGEPLRLSGEEPAGQGAAGKGAMIRFNPDKITAAPDADALTTSAWEDDAIEEIVVPKGSRISREAFERMKRDFVIKETEDGRYRATRKGTEAAASEAAPEMPKPKVAPVEKIPAPTRSFSSAFEQSIPQIERELQAEADKRKLGATVKLSPLISTGDNATRGARGAYADKLIAVSHAYADPSKTPTERRQMLKTVVTHEGVHRLRQADRFTPGEWRSLVGFTKRQKMPGSKETIHRAQTARYQGRPGYETQDAVDQEAVAKLFELASEGTVTLSGAPKQSFTKLGDFVGALGRALRGHGFDNVEKIYRDFEAGVIGGRRDAVRTYRLTQGTVLRPLVPPMGDLPERRQMAEWADKDYVSAREASPKFALADHNIVPSQDWFGKMHDVLGEWLNDPDSGGGQALADLQEEFGEVNNQYDLATPEQIQREAQILVNKLASIIGPDYAHGVVASADQTLAPYFNNQIPKGDNANFALLADSKPINFGELTPDPSFGQGGSNLGGRFTDPAGNKWYVKSPQSAEHAHNEIVAAKFYEKLGVPVPDVRVVDFGTKGATINGQQVKGNTGIASLWEDMLESDKETLVSYPEAVEHLHENYVVDAWLGNWDVVGLTYDNIKIRTTDKKNFNDEVTGVNYTAVRIDPGGALLFRAQGQKKTNSQFNEVVSELESLRDPGINPTAHAVFKDISDEDLKKGADKVASLSDQDIYDIVNSYGPPANADMRKHLAQTLIKRRDYIRHQFNTADPAKSIPYQGANFLTVNHLATISKQVAAKNPVANQKYQDAYISSSDDKGIQAFESQYPDAWKKYLKDLHATLRQYAPSGYIHVYRTEGALSGYGGGAARSGRNWRFGRHPEHYPYASMTVNPTFGKGGLTGRYGARVKIEDVIGVSATLSNEAEVTVRREGIEQNPFLYVNYVQPSSSEVDHAKVWRATAGVRKATDALPHVQEKTNYEGVSDPNFRFVWSEPTAAVAHLKGNKFRSYPGAHVTIDFTAAALQREINAVAAEAIEGAEREKLPFTYVAERLADGPLRQYWHANGNTLPDYARPGIDLSISAVSVKGGAAGKASTEEVSRTIGRLFGSMQNEVEVSLFNEHHTKQKGDFEDQFYLSDGSEINAARIIWVPEMHVSPQQLLRFQSKAEVDKFFRSQQANIHRQIESLSRLANTISVGGAGESLLIPRDITRDEIREFWKIASGAEPMQDAIDQASYYNKPLYSAQKYLRELSQNRDHVKLRFMDSKRSATVWYYDVMSASHGDYHATKQYLRGEFSPEDFTSVVGPGGTVESPFANRPHGGWRRSVSSAVLRRFLADDAWRADIPNDAADNIHEHVSRLWAEEFQPFEHQQDSKLRHVAEYNQEWQGNLDELKQYRDLTPDQLERLVPWPESLTRLYSLPDYDDNLSQPQNDVMDKLSPYRKPMTAGQSFLAALRERPLMRWRMKFVDRWAKIAENSRLRAEAMGDEKEAYADVSAASAAYHSDRARGVFAAALKYGVPLYKDGFTKVVSEVDGQRFEGLIDVLKPLYQNQHGKNLVRHWHTYSIALRENRFDAEGRKVLTTDAERRTALEIAIRYPEVRQVHEVYQKWNANIVKFLRDTGVIDDANAVMWMEHSDYIPFYRQLDNERTQGPVIFNGLANVEPPRRAKGSDHLIVADPIENIAKNALAAITAGMRNVAAQRAVRDAIQLGQAEDVTNLPGGANLATHTIRVGGKVRHIAIDDPILFETMTSMFDGKMIGLGLFSTPATVLREMVTRDPGFMMANLLRDTLSTWVSTGSKFVPVWDTFSNFAADIPQVLSGRHGGTLQALERSGVIGGYEFTNDPKHIKEYIRRELKKKGAVSRTGWDAIRYIWDKAGDLTTASDAATRQGVYRRVLAETGNEAEAIFQALEVINFARRGSSPVMRYVTAAIPFLNARIQGLDKLYRSARGRDAARDTGKPGRAAMRMLLRGSTLMALTAGYYSLVSDDDDWKNATNEERDDHWIIPLGKGLPTIKIPVPFEVGVLFKTIPERLMALYSGEDINRDLSKSVKRAITNTLEVSPYQIQALAPYMEASSNFSSFTQREIVPWFMEKMSAPEQATMRTSDTAKVLSRFVDAVGQSLGLVDPGVENPTLDIFRSPMKMEHLLKGYTGTLGTYVLSLTDALVREISGSPERPDKRLDEYPVVKRFLHNELAQGQLQQYYDLRNAVDEVVADLNALKKQGRFEDYTDYYTKYGWLYNIKTITKIADRQLGRQRDVIEMIYRHPTMSGEEKQVRVEKILRGQIDALKFVPGLRKAVFEDLRDKWESTVADIERMKAEGQKT